MSALSDGEKTGLRCWNEVETRRSNEPPRLTPSAYH
jgi:hypothetical protein